MNSVDAHGATALLLTTGGTPEMLRLPGLLLDAGADSSATCCSYFAGFVQRYISDALTTMIRERMDRGEEDAT